MKQFVEPTKRSKKAQKELAAKQRVTWGGLNPVTRTVPNKGRNAYDRNRSKQEVRCIDW